MFRKIMLMLTLFVLFALSFSGAGAQDESFELTIVHTMETHSNHLPCCDGNGGVARQASVIKQIRAEVENSILLDSGDRFTGTLFHVQHRGQDNVQIMNLLGYDAMTLGNHELDEGQDVLASFVNGLNFPAVVANVDYSGSEALDGLIDPWTILEVGGEQIGVIGLTNRETPTLVRPENVTNLEFGQDYVAATQVAVDALSEQGINKIVLVTHIERADDEAVAGAVSGIDVIIGGHVGEVLFSNTRADAAGPYPLELESASGEPVLLVYIGRNSEFLGRMDLEFDAAGVLTDWEGDAIHLSRYITPDVEAQALVEALAEPLEALRGQAVGEAEVFLTGDRAVCRAEECNLGNLITDAIRDETGVQIVITNAGGIRADIDEGEVTMGEVLTVLPFGNLVSTFEISGADVLAALENGVSRIELLDDGSINREGLSGRFAQVSGLRFSYDPSAEAGSRVVSVEVLNADGEFEPLDPDASYSGATNDFMRTGGDGYSMLRDNATNVYDAGRPLDQVVADYIAANSPVAPGTEGRITRADEG